MSPFEVVLFLLIPIVGIAVFALIGWLVAKMFTGAEARIWAQRWQS